MCPVPEGQGIHSMEEGKEVGWWVWPRKRGEEKCSVGVVSGGQTGMRCEGSTGDVAYAEGSHGGVSQAGGWRGEKGVELMRS